MDRRISLKQKNARRARRRGRVRKLVSGTAARPRLTVFRSLSHIYAQIVDDATGTTLAAAGSSTKDAAAGTKGLKKSDVSKVVGKAIAERALAKNIVSVVFDRNGYQYHGRVKALADSAREAGLKF